LFNLIIFEEYKLWSFSIMLISLSPHITCILISSQTLSL